MILLGFEIPSGRRVEIPDEGHAAFFGQTQLSGKTTLIEAITYRAPANVKAVAFITKRGEGSFLTARMIPPYFSEPSNDPEQPLWRWVSAILEASQQRKLRFEESWIIRACEDPKMAKSLADVHANIKVLLGGEGEYYQKTKKKRAHRWIHKPVTGINAGVYTSLNAYFQIVMPQLARMPYTKTLSLKPGLNVMDLREYSIEAQGMVIRSVMEHVYENERNTRVIVPEAQDFVPQGRNSPVKMACETMVRKGAALHNFMWLDSQDMAAVEKTMLRAVSILGCGVQGEAHEMNRSIAHLFGAATKLTPRDIGSLKIGQFYLRLAGGDVTKVYVQPAWMDSEVHARAIAMGQESVSTARQILRKFKEERESHAEAETEDSGRTVEGIQDHEGASVPDRIEPEHEDHDSGTQGESIQSGTDAGEARRSSPIAESGAGGVIPRRSRLTEGIPEFVLQAGDVFIYPEAGCLKETLVGDDGVVRHFDHDTGLPWEAEAMKTLTPIDTLRSYLGYTCVQEIPSFHQAIIDVLNDHRRLIESHDALAARVRALESTSSPAGVSSPEVASPERTGDASAIARKGDGGNGAAVATKMAPAAPGIRSGNGPWSGTPAQLSAADLEDIYEWFKVRAAKDPGILQLLSSRPELRVTVQRTVIELDDSTLAGKCARLISKGFFKSPMGVAAAQKELRRLGSEQPTTNVRRALDKLNEQGFLTAEADGFQEVPGMKINIVEGK
jgi:hypothetical protein